MPRRKAIKWPNDAKIAISPCVAFEIWPDDIGTAGSLNISNRPPLPAHARFKKDISVITDRQFGERVGVFRMLDLFEKENIKTTFFINGIVTERLYDIANEIRQKGHEIATESYIHDYNFMKTCEEEKEDLQKTVAAVKKATGENPTGYLSMGVQPTENTPVLIAQAGYKYWADPQHEEIPYTLQVDDKILVVFNYLLYLNDYSSYPWDSRTPRDLLQIWKDCFDCLYEEGKDGNPKTMIWGLHPFLTGRPYRLQVLKEFLRYAKGHPGVWFARCADIAKWWLDNYKENHVERWPNCLEVLDPPYQSGASKVK